ncbi:hypothetical protein AWH69_02495 [Janibacter melonis]|uniref:Aromatic amino acid beta-eliminating lyase/threonine aldolase domain-containing protein n=1 Tax=Janibacter melonis TaxID=262209 RepID=A0A176QG46_9MICO|nr:beta-eliminating lyase-related protein [Janibacter melonis]OAB88683.1 hypothetical protein AWH69_02495 [Janibacter melonis]
MWLARAAGVAFGIDLVIRALCVDQVGMGLATVLGTFRWSSCRCSAGGGRVWTVEQMTSVVEAAHDGGLATHLDGARVLNAAVAAGVEASAFASQFDTAWLDFSKGLGAPVGAVLVGSRELVHEAWRYKQMWGGAMRQSGIIAAAGLYALDHHVDRLADDHTNAARLARGLASIQGVEIEPAHVETNIVYFEVPDAHAFEAGLAEHGVVMNAKGPRRVRAVTHLDVSTEQIDQAIAAARVVLENHFSVANSGRRGH